MSLPYSSSASPPRSIHIDSGRATAITRKAAPVPIKVYTRPTTFYPTPPASPDLDNSTACLPSIGDIGFAISTGLFTPPPDVVEIDHIPSPPRFASSVSVVPLDALDFDPDLDLDEEDSEEFEELQPESDLSATAQDHEVAQVSPDSARPPLQRQGSRSFGIPIPILLDTSHDLPHASTFRLASPNSLLSSLGGNRILLLGASQTVWDRMPYSAASAAVAGRVDDDEESVETLIGGEREEAKISGLQWGLRSKKSRERISSIFVHPPTPEKSIPNGDNSGTSRSDPATPTGRKPSPTPPTIPTLPDEPFASSSSGPSRSLPIQVLPEVRSPPRRAIALAADSLQLAKGRGRRPKLFGFTEISDSSSSANSSRQTSPERSERSVVVESPPVDMTPTLSAPPIPNPVPPPRPATAAITPERVMPPKALARTQSETSLPTMSVIASNTPAFQPPRGRRVSGLKLDFAGIVPVVSHEDPRAAVVPSPYSSRLIRKKSGEILKSALKYIGPLGPNGTPLKQSGPESPLEELEDTPRARFESKSLPATPSCPKYVHFDTQLERVKLFLQDQKPQVVSRDGSPTADYTTSEGEEYPFPSTDEEDGPVRKVLQIKLPNFPTSHPPDAELYLESLFLEEDRKSLKGMILCKNLSFQKWVAARFTLDFWQTTSEVTAQHKETVRGGLYDRFTFVIKLHDVLARINEKTLFVALRYYTAGKEIWDSNGGQNYQVLFENVVPPTVTLGPKRANSLIQPGMGKAVGGRTSQWSVTGGGRGDDRLADLRAKLSHLTGGDPDNSPPPASPSRSGPLSPRYGMMSFSSAISPTNSPHRSGSDQNLPELPSAGPAFSARYDFGQALKTTRDHRKTSPNGKGDDLPVRTGLLNFPTSTKANNGHAATEFYSPRFSPSKLPEALPTHDLLFSPLTSASTDFSTPNDSPPKEPKEPNGLKISHLPTPSFAIQEPSPPDLEDADEQKLLVTLRSSASPQRPTPARSVSTPEKRSGSTDKEAPRHFEHSNVSILQSDTSKAARSIVGGSILNGTAVANRGPTSPPSPTPVAISPRWSPTSTKKGDMSLASYSSLIEQFCWGGAASPPAHTTRRSSSTSDLNSYFHESAPLVGSTSGYDAGESRVSPDSTATLTRGLGGSPTRHLYGSPPSYAMPGHHRSSSFTSPLTDARGHVVLSPSASPSDADGLMFNSRELGVGRTSMAC